MNLLKSIQNKFIRQSKNLDRKHSVYSRLSTIFVFLVIYVVLILAYKPNLLFSLTTTSGGDMGAHHYAAKFLIEELLPRFRLSGWSMGWYAGIPMFSFYFPLPFLLIALLSKIIPYLIAFKLITVLGVFMLPLAAYAFARLLRFQSPLPQLAAIFAAVFLFMKSYSIYGGNILSTLAGEFSYSLSFALVFIFMGTLYRGMERGRFDWLFVLNCLILTTLALSHVVTTISLILMVPGLLLINRQWKSVIYVVSVFLIGFCLTAFWSLPFLDKFSWTTNMGWMSIRTLKDYLPVEIRPAAVIALVGIIYSFRKKDIRTIPLLWGTFIFAVVFFVLPEGRLWNGRLLPFLFFLIYIWAAYGFYSLFNSLILLLKKLFGIQGEIISHVYTPIIAVILGFVIFFSSAQAQNWIRWNYSGYESKENWAQYERVMDYLNTLPSGRVMNEHDNDRIGKFGTPRAFELIPYWTDQPVMEGTLPESSFTAPFHFINQAELSVHPGSGIGWIDFPSVNVSRGITHLQLMNISYLIVSSPEVVGEMARDQRVEFLVKIGDFSIFRIKNSSGYVEIMKNWPLRLKTNSWQKTIIPWYLEESALDVPVIWDRGEVAIKVFDPIEAPDLISPPIKPINAEGVVKIEIIENEKIFFKTTAVGYPHLVKVSYFPNWRAQGADGPFVVSPSFMMVIPRQQEVTLIYEKTNSEIIGLILTLVSWVALFILLILNLKRIFSLCKRSKELVH